MATGGKLKPIPEALQARTKAQMTMSRSAPREDHSWQYWMRVAERLDPEFAA